MKLTCLSYSFSSLFLTKVSSLSVPLANSSNFSSSEPPFSMFCLPVSSASLAIRVISHSCTRKMGEALNFCTNIYRVTREVEVDRLSNSFWVRSIAYLFFGCLCSHIIFFRALFDFLYFKFSRWLNCIFPLCNLFFSSILTYTGCVRFYTYLYKE